MTAIGKLRRWTLGETGDMRIVPPGAQSARSVGLLSAIMAFFAIVVLALALAAGRLAETWEGSLADTATLQILGGGEDVEEQARAALDVLRTTPGVRGVRMIEVAEQRALLEPWLGSEAALDSLPLPLLIEVATDPDRLNIESLTLRLQAEAPAAVYDDHGAWRASLVTTAERLRLFAFASFALLVAVLAGVLGLAAHAAVAANGPAIRTLRQVGARDRYIAGAFTRRYVVRALQGALAGGLVGLILLALLPSASEPGFFLVGIGPQGWHWLILALVPVAVALVARLATGRAVRRALRRWS